MRYIFDFTGLLSDWFIIICFLWDIRMLFLRRDHLLLDAIKRVALTQRAMLSVLPM